MSSLFEVVIFSLLGGVVSLTGGFILVSDKKRALKFANYATPFAAGALLAAAFLDLLREGTHDGNAEVALSFALAGILIFFLLERFLRWFHHHHEEDGSHKDPDVPLIVIGDTLHNFIDGVAIAAGFLVDTNTGIIVTLAVAAHEIPQEIGDFGLMIAKGMERSKVILVNLLSALTTVIAAVFIFQLGQGFELRFDVILGLVAGFFIYIAVSDIIPAIQKTEEVKIATIQTILLLAGVLIVGVTTTVLHDTIEQNIEDNHIVR